MKTEGLKWLFWALRMLIAVLFIYSGLVKIFNPQAFAEQVMNYRLLPYLFVTLIAVVLPWLELICGLLLMVNKWLHGTLLLLVAMNLVFLIAVGAALIQGLDISCGCFSVGDEGTHIGIKKLFENVLLTLASLVLYSKVLSADTDQVIQHCKSN
ncbi:MAG TPA: MauE/DoxX family redox-associated membrane protein [bacterium]|nr:MauE/DoxX family redox-associated membrane protein [bacterium]HNT67007.1 MauE/DoxX family redox-associated membrane protein [bacterium]HOX86896.1 MauE/DoxX family redox-associated membrane protein [bacterium]HPG46227.1 MauE/DoxX family redox-associated membrane protein [bacterium]HPM98579.1 MauE/DoxX family redox-associated membrane protein [bacterium]